MTLIRRHRLLHRGPRRRGPASPAFGSPAPRVSANLLRLDGWQVWGALVEDDLALYVSPAAGAMPHQGPTIELHLGGHVWLVEREGAGREVDLANRRRSLAAALTLSQRTITRAALRSDGLFGLRFDDGALLLAEAVSASPPPRRAQPA